MQDWTETGKDTDCKTGQRQVKILIAGLDRDKVRHTLQDWRETGKDTDCKTG